MRRTILTGAMLLSMASLTFAQDAATQPTSQPATVDPTDKAAAQAAEGQQAVIEGKVTKAAWSRSGKTMSAHFAKGADSFELVIFARNKDDMDKAFGGDVAAALNGATVRATGMIKDYRGRPEMIINDASQLTITQPAATEPAASEPTTQP